MNRATTKDTSQKLAAIDIGSNAIRILIRDYSTPFPEDIFSKRFNLRLGSDTFSQGALSPSSTEQFLGIFEEVSSLLKRFDVDRYRAVATSALRESSNAESLIQEVASETGVNIEVITGEEEADTILAAVNELNLGSADVVVADLGGGSLEVVHARKGKRKGFATLPLGAVRALQYYNDSPEHLQGQIAKVFEGNEKRLADFSQNPKNGRLLLGTGGNIRAINKLANRLISGKIHKKTLTRDQLSIVLDALSKKSVKQREKELDLAKDRADVILPAAHVFYELMFYFGYKSIFVPKVSLKHGILAQLRR